MIKINLKIIGLIILGGIFILPSLALAGYVGEKKTFFVDSGYDISDRDQVNSTLRAMGNKIYFYVEDDYYNSLNGTYKNGIRERLEELAEEFDTVIYPKERAVFGSEWTPGIDNDERITVLVTQLVSNAGGYFNIYDEFPKSQVSRSNEREMIYFNSANIFTSNSKALLAHEFQHLITFYQKSILHGKEEEVWLNEARSEYAPTVCGYDDDYGGSYLASRVNTFIDDPDDPLGEWKNDLSDYGSVNLFLHYLVDHYGQNVITQMALSDKTGIDSINESLSNLGYSENFSDIFNNWVVANYLNDCRVGSKYCYLNPNLTAQRLKVDYSSSYSGFPNLIVSRSASIKDWSPRWYRFRQNGVVSTEKDNLEIVFDFLSDKSNFRVPYIITQENGQSTVHSLLIEGKKGTALIPNFTSLNKTVTVIPFNQYKEKNFSSNDSLASFTFTASSVSGNLIEEPEVIEGDSPETPLMDYPDGSLIRAKNGYKVYITKGKYKRWIQTAELFNHYGHLKWEDIIDVDQSVLDGYQESWMIRADGQKKVYELNADGTKHWLNMTAEEFSLTGHKWDMVYIINAWEIDYYINGSDVMFE